MIELLFELPLITDVTKKSQFYTIEAILTVFANFEKKNRISLFKDLQNNSCSKTSHKQNDTHATFTRGKFGVIIWWVYLL